MSLNCISQREQREAEDRAGQIEIVADTVLEAPAHPWKKAKSFADMGATHHYHSTGADYNRKLTDGERTVKLIQACDHRRLTYKEQTSKNRDSLGRHTDR